MKNTLYHYGKKRDFEFPLVTRLASDYGLELRLDGASFGESHFAFVNLVKTLKYVNMITLWNGMLCCGPLITRLCIEKNIPRCYLEWGMLPQHLNVFVDPLGFAGNSILNYDVSWVTKEDMENLANKRKEMQNWYKVEDEGYVLVPLQKENDTQILYHTKYKNMNEFVEDIIKMYPNNRIIIKPHPKEEKLDDFVKTWKENKKIEIADERVDFLRLAAKASVIVGLTSTTLYESGVLGKPVVSLASHPLSITNHNDKEKVLAGALFLNINGATGSVKKVLDRFSIKPLS